jgi:heat shock protein Hsp15
MNKVRIDKWLWAARFFKTRSLAKQAIDGGKIHLNGARVKASKDIEEGMTLQVRQGYDEREVLVLALSDQRRGAPEAAKLYQETQASMKNAHSTQRNANRLAARVLTLPASLIRVSAASSINLSAI